MLAKLAAPVGKLQVEITRTIVGCNCCPNVDCSLIKILLKEMRMLLMLPIKRSSPGNTVLVTADEAMSSFASGRFRGRRVAAVLWRSTQILSSSKLSELRIIFYKLLLGSKNLTMATRCFVYRRRGHCVRLYAGETTLAASGDSMSTESIAAPGWYLTLLWPAPVLQSDRRKLGNLEFFVVKILENLEICCWNSEATEVNGKQGTVTSCDESKWAEQQLCQDCLELVYTRMNLKAKQILDCIHRESE